MNGKEIEIVFLDYIKNRKEKDIERIFLNEFIEELKDGRELFDGFLEQGLLKEADSKEKLNFLKVTELAEIAAKLKIQISNKKNEIIEMIINKYENGSFAEELDFNAYIITEKGQVLIDDYLSEAKKSQEEKSKKIIEFVKNNEIKEAYELNKNVKVIGIPDLFNKEEWNSEDSEELFLKAFEELEKIKFSKYIDNSEEFIKSFILYYKCSNLDYKNRGIYKEYFIKENLEGPQIERMKLTHGKTKKVDEKVFDDFEQFISFKVSSVFEIENLKMLEMKYKIDNSECPIHKEQKTEEIYEEIGCKCLVMIDM